MMKWATAIATDGALSAAVSQAAAQVFAGLGHSEPDLLVAFVSHEHQRAFDSLGPLLRAEFESAMVFGCSASGVIGGGEEVEDGPCLSLTAAVLPDVRLAGNRFGPSEVPPVFAERRLWEEALGASAAEQPAFLVLADPFSAETSAFLRGLDRAFPGCTVLGGLASGAQRQGSAALYVGDGVHRAGLVTLALTGDIALHAGLSQGSRPVGDPMFVTSAHDNLVRELDGRIPRELVAELFERLPAADRRLFSDMPALGIAAVPGRATYAAGDFLVRSILGLDPQSGALWLDTGVEANAVVQLHVRDVPSAARDVERTLRQLRETAIPAEPAAALLFSCVSRGAGFYGQPGHDTHALHRFVGDVPVGGFFCEGEVGQVAGTTHVHAHTSAFGLVTPRSRRDVTAPAAATANGNGARGG